MTSSKRQALIELLDDSSPIVRKELLDEFTRLGSHGIQFLNELSSSSNRIHIWHANRIIEELRQSNPISMFRNFIQSQSYELETGCFHLAKIMYPELTISQFCLSIEKITNRCKQISVEPSSPKDRCTVINRVLFHELGFRGNIENYEAPENSFLNKVIENRKGIPISLSCLYILIAQRLNLDLEGIAIPGHFMVACYEEDYPIYIDPFERGRFWSSSDLLQRLEQTSFVSNINILTPVPVREILSRCCRNLVSHYAQIGDSQNSQLFHSFVTEFGEVYNKSHHP
ncbi:transglutaminase-like domain-containing protein [Puniceicoccaceae bacterium K14]|nr:transglutaminase-like domain-containing protein [Puniceicoccaceae bacterium K14]